MTSTHTLADMRNASDDENFGDTDDVSVTEKSSEYLRDRNKALCDYFSEQLREAFEVEAVEFPRLEQPDALLQRLEESYMPNVDVVEVYAARNIFTLGNIPANRQSRVAQLFWEHRTVDTISLDLPADAPEPNDASHFSCSAEEVDMKDVATNPPVTQEQVQSTRQAVQDLQQQLVLARQHKATLQRRLKQLEMAQTLCTWPTDPTALANDVKESVATVVLGVRDLESCQEQGEVAVAEAKRRRWQEENDHPRNHDDDDDERLRALDPLSPQPQSVEELYRKERQQIRASNQDLNMFHQLITGGRVPS